MSYQHVRREYYPGYDIVMLTPENNTLIAAGERASFAVSLSGGLGSAIAGERAIRRHGRHTVLLWFADVRTEDPDLYRFLHDLMARWGGTLYWYTDGRRPMDVWSEHKIIPTNMLAPCSYELKVDPFRRFISAMPGLPIVYIGYKPHEKRRQCNTIASYAKAIPLATVEYPLLWDPQESRPLPTVCREEMGIEPPRLYQLGYDYNNCGGCCCRSGIASWVRTASSFPERFAAYERWEQEARAQWEPGRTAAFAFASAMARRNP